MSEPSKPFFGTLIGITVSAVVLTAINVAITLTIMDRYGLLHAPEIVSIDAANMVMGFVAAQDPGISEEDLQQRIRSLNANLDGVIATFARERGVIVVNSAAVLGGTRDVTPEMLASLGLSQ
ncbi:TrbI F-type domain-containing protein [Yoonia sp. SS1-5]|uniref:TrbI F-type domain-containing protein n=1 Tax=Yoonia rhodophyticola TaxID=3137370 RepID=A0AAN0NH34_9RHOB